MTGAATCAFCAIVGGELPASIVCEDALSLCFVDLRQFHPGHVLVIPRRHLRDIRDLDEESAASLMSMAARVARALSRAFPNEGLSLWHSIGAGADQEVPHMHLHIHPRRIGDQMLRVYPEPPQLPEREVLDHWATAIRSQLAPL